MSADAESDLNAVFAAEDAADLAVAEILRDVAGFDEPVEGCNPLGPSRAELELERLRESDPSDRQIEQLADRLRGAEREALPLDLALLVRRHAQLAKRSPRRSLRPRAASTRLRVRRVQTRGRSRRPGCSGRRKPQSRSPGGGSDSDEGEPGEARPALQGARP
jgi:hypothetical protein